MSVNLRRDVKDKWVQSEVSQGSGVATGVARGAECQIGKNWKKIKKNREKEEKSGKNQEKEEKSGRNGNNREISFTLPLLTDRAGYATKSRPPLRPSP